ncbi:hypothetical protein Tbd_2066 [Thiobacillus denitrificans ATCC 25259]|uniref:Uncharacterized protein n=1 Tax=Thiobacillus denitrificans (strain ATCC 25259 / T1) TaxID=292415 RepID=Q3SH70_THIDA|nr:hypothetical protein Tbd_2066 [Thiobacillus denitrificans ATCC 25259]
MPTPPQGRGLAWLHSSPSSLCVGKVELGAQYAGLCIRALDWPELLSLPFGVGHAPFPKPFLERLEVPQISGPRAGVIVCSFLHGVLLR